MTSRRKFLTSSLLGASGIALGLISYRAYRVAGRPPPVKEAMGPLGVVTDEATGLPLLRLPEGFRYRSLSWAGSELNDGHRVPGAADGMGVVRQEGNLITLVRNHELHGTSAPIGNPELAYDDAPGGTTTLVFDGEKEALVDSWVSLGGTLNNCAGGVTPWGTWLSCEESTITPEMAHLSPPAYQRFWKADSARRAHGFVFEVPAAGISSAEPILDMGQFRHEAVVIDPSSGFAYLTEDIGPEAGFYRFLPNIAGELTRGGRLQMMKVIGHPVMYDKLILGRELDVEWVDIADPTAGLVPEYPNGDGVVNQGLTAGGSAFRSLEGCAIDGSRVYFTSKNGGPARAGYVYEYRPEQEKIQLVFASPDNDYFSGPDNLVVSPRGGLVVCEDRVTQNNKAQSIAGLTREGEFFRFCQINPRLRGTFAGHNLAATALKSEWAGATFSGDGKWLFLNIYNPGVTLAITGPWQDGYF